MADPFALRLVPIQGVEGRDPLLVSNYRPAISATRLAWRLRPLPTRFKTDSMLPAIYMNDTG